MNAGDLPFRYLQEQVREETRLAIWCNYSKSGSLPAPLLPPQLLLLLQLELFASFASSAFLNPELSNGFNRRKHPIAVALILLAQVAKWAPGPASAIRVAKHETTIRGISCVQAISRDLLGL
jgi:hypothetical protein